MSQGGCGNILGAILPRKKVKAPAKVFHVEDTEEQFPHMPIVQIMLDKMLLRAADQPAKRTQRNRSALVRDALREHLRRLELRANEERDRQGYSRQSPANAEVRGWESVATWPEE